MRHLPAVLIVLTASGTVLDIGCGSIALDRLEGEPASTHAFTSPQGKRTHPAVDGVQRFVRAVQQGEAEAAWEQLSLATRKSLHSRAKQAGMRGIDLLIRKQWPVGVASSVPFEPLTVFAVPAVVTLQPVGTPDEGADVVQQRVKLGAEGGGERIVTLRFEGHAWRLHQPVIDLPAFVTAAAQL
jgi:hypothetical protein